jgi:hypothetical protein
MPLLFLFVFTLVGVFAAIEVGFRLGLRQPLASKEQVEGASNSMIQATLALLAFLLAFTFGIAADRFNDRRVLVIEDTNAIQTAYLRADLLPDDSKNAIQKLLRQYVQVRVGLSENPKLIWQTRTESEKLHKQIWDETTKVARAHMDQDVMALFVESINEVIDVHTQRVSARLYARIPESIWIMMYTIMFFGMMALGYQSGVERARSWMITVSLVLSFAMLTVLIADLDSPTEGLLMASQEPMLDLGKKLGPP